MRMEEIYPSIFFSQSFRLQKKISVEHIAAYSKQWWQAAGYDPSRLSDVVGDESKHALLGNPVESAQSIDDQSERKVEDDDDKASKDSAATGSTSTHQEGSNGLEGQKSQCAESAMPFVSGVGLPQHPQLRVLFGHPVEFVKRMEESTMSTSDIYEIKEGWAQMFRDLVH